MNYNDLQEYKSRSVDLYNLMKRLYARERDVQTLRDEEKAIKDSIQDLLKNRMDLEKKYADLQNNYAKLKIRADVLGKGILEDVRKAKNELVKVQKCSTELSQLKREYGRMVGALRARQKSYGTKLGELLLSQRRVNAEKKAVQKAMDTTMGIKNKVDKDTEMCELRIKSLDLRDKNLVMRSVELDNRIEDYEKKSRELKNQMEAFRQDKNKYFETTKKRRKNR